MYVVHNGEKFVVDGQHRLRAVRELRIQEIMAEEVSLPFKDYKVLDDLWNLSIDVFKECYGNLAIRSTSDSSSEID